jgi:hypothetical protein
MKKNLLSILVTPLVFLWFCGECCSATCDKEDQKERLQKQVQILQAQVGLNTAHLQQELEALEASEAFFPLFNPSSVTSLEDVLAALEEIPEPLQTYNNLCAKSDREFKEQALFIRMNRYFESLGEGTGLAAYATFYLTQKLVKQLSAYIKDLEIALEKNKQS